MTRKNIDNKLKDFEIKLEKLPSDNNKKLKEIASQLCEIGYNLVYYIRTGPRSFYYPDRKRR